MVIWTKNRMNSNFRNNTYDVLLLHVIKCYYIILVSRSESNEGTPKKWVKFEDEKNIDHKRDVNIKDTPLKENGNNKIV